MSTKTQLIIEIILFTIALVFTAYKLNSDYKTYGRLNFLAALYMNGLIAFQCWMSVTAIFIPAGYLHNQVLFTLGCVFMFLGLGLLVLGVRKFGDFKKLIGISEPKLTIKGIYAYTRHPQYLGYFFIISGMALAWWNHYAITAIITAMMMIYVFVWIEDAHLNRTFGQLHTDYCSKTPRFL